MSFFSDFRIFERPPKRGSRLLRWIAWRWFVLGFFFTCLVLVFAVFHFIDEAPIYYTNEKRNITNAEAWDMFLVFLSGGSFFLIAGFLGILYLPKR